MSNQHIRVKALQAEVGATYANIWKQLDTLHDSIRGALACTEEAHLIRELRLLEDAILGTKETVSGVATTVLTKAKSPLIGT